MASSPAEVAPCALAIEHHAQCRNIALRADPFALDHDCGDHRLQLRIGNRRTVDLPPSLTLRVLPSLLPRCLARFSANIDFDPAHFDVGTGSGRRDTAFSGYLRQDQRIATAKQR